MLISIVDWVQYISQGSYRVIKLLDKHSLNNIKKKPKQLCSFQKMAFCLLKTFPPLLFQDPHDWI